MDVLNNLVQSLSVTQKKMVSQYLISFSNKKEGTTQAILLFNLLKKEIKGELSESDYSLQLFGNVNLPKLYTIKSRLKNKILETIISDQNIETQERLDELDETSIRLRKKILQMRTIYWTQGNLLIVQELLSRIIKTATNFELYDILFDALNFKKGLIGLREGKFVYKRFLKELDFVELCLRSTYRAGRLYNEYIVDKKFNAEQSHSEKLNRINLIKEELDSLFKQTKTKNIHYYLNLFEIEFLELKGDNQGSRNKIIEQLNYLKRNKAVNRKSRIGFCYSNLSMSDIIIGEYRNAYKNSITAQSYMLVNSFNYLVCESMKFYSGFYDRNIINAEASLIILRNHMKEDQGAFNSATYDFFQANLHFVKADYSKALKLAAQNLEISKDKSGWDIALRILTIMCMVELGNEDQAGTSVEALRKQVQRVNKTNSLSKRDLLIVKIIQQIAKNGFAFESLTADDLKGFHELSEENTILSWKPLTPELIPFHEWVELKIRKISPRKKERYLNNL